MCFPGASFVMGLVGQIPGIAKGVLDYEAKKINAQVQNHAADTDAAKTIAVEELKGRVEERKALATLASHHDKLVGFIGAAFAVHIWAYVLDAVFHLGWHIDALPDPIGSYEGQFLLFLIGGGAATSIAKGLIQKVWK